MTAKASLKMFGSDVKAWDFTWILSKHLAFYQRADDKTTSRLFSLHLKTDAPDP